MEWEETLGEDGYAYSLDGDDGFRSLYLSTISSSCIH